MSRRRTLLLVLGVTVIALTSVAGYASSTASSNSQADLRDATLNALRSSGALSIEAKIYEVTGEESRLAETIRQQLDKDNRRNIVRWYDENNELSRSVVVDGHRYLSVNHELPWVYSRTVQQEAGPEQLGVAVVEDILRDGQLVAHANEALGASILVMILPGNTRRAVVEIGSNGLPAQVEFPGGQNALGQASGGGPTPPDKTVIAYQYTDRGPVTSAETEIDIPHNLVGREDYQVLAKEAPKAPNKTYGQYWLGKEFNGRVVVSAQSIVFTPRQDYEPVPGDMVSVVYRYPVNGSAGGTKPGDLQLSSHPLKGTGGEDSLKWIIERVESEGDERRDIEVAGSPATAYILGPSHEGGPVNGAILLPDAIVLFDAERPGPGDVDALLAALQEVK